MSTRARILQIYYDAASKAALDPAFEPLDNTANARPDWFEYGPILEFLRREMPDNDAMLGFLSPRFANKTQLAGEAVHTFLATHPAADVVTFSPTPEHASIFINVFEHGANYHPGLAEAAQGLFDHIGLAIDLKALVMDTRTSVFANYFVARGRFWRRWADLAERCVAVADDPASPLHPALNAPSEYYRSTQMKIFVLERLASALLATSPNLVIRNYPPFTLPLSETRFVPFFDNYVALDALKRAYSQSGDRAYLDAFRAMQKAVSDAIGRERAAR